MRNKLEPEAFYLNREEREKAELVRRETDLMEEAKRIFSGNARMFKLYGSKIADCKTAEEFDAIEKLLEEYKAKHEIK